MAPQRARSRLAESTSLALLALASATLILSLVVPARLWILAYPDDDGLVYGLTAWNTVGGHPFSFDHATRTTGFHWAGLLVPMAVAGLHQLFVGPDGPAALFRWLYPVDCLVLVASALVCTALARRLLQGRSCDPLAFVLFVLALIDGFGMESVLLPPQLLALAWYSWQRRSPSLPVLLGLSITLTRIDYAPAAVVLAFLAGRAARVPTARPALLTLTGVLAGAALVAGLNCLVAGDPLSSSLLAKAFYASVLDYRFRLPTPDAVVLVLALAVMLRHRPPIVAAVLATGMLLFLQVLVAGATTIGVGNWYSVPSRVLFTVPLLVPLNVLLQRARVWLVRIALGGLLVAITAAYGPARLRERVRYFEATVLEYARRVEIGRRLRDASSPSARLAVIDGAPACAYVTGRPIVGLDGLVASPRFARDYLPRSRQVEYVRDHVDYLIVLVAVESLSSTPMGRFLYDLRAWPLGPYRRPVRASLFEFGPEDIALRIPLAPWTGVSEVWLVRVKPA
jgi:hypothetical protein